MLDIACLRSINGSDFNHVEVYITLKGYWWVGLSKYQLIIIIIYNNQLSRLTMI
ncbi:hypothetical protein VCR9J2_930022 [Vibrio crassostreae]|nr:hypothetical protein VCR9J2_930022 [Vibrio crassostreae]